MRSTMIKVQFSNNSNKQHHLKLGGREEKELEHWNEVQKRAGVLFPNFQSGIRKLVESTNGLLHFDVASVSFLKIPYQQLS